MNSKPKPTGGLTAGKVIKGIFATIGRLFATMIMVGVITGCIVASVLTVYILGYVGADDEISLDTEKLGYSSTMVAYDKNGNEVELQKLYLPDNNRIWVDYVDISEYVKDAVIAIEDKRFDEHQGVDWRRTFGAFVNMFMPGASEGGGSTITQQLIKNITEDDDVRVDRKVREIFRALDLEKRYTKDQILEAYLNVVPFGAGTNGIESAAQTYFGKSAKDLDLAEAASIVGITKYPTYYNPRINPENNKDRQEDVLWFMYEQEKITEAEYESALKQKLNFRRDDVQQTEKQMMTYFEDYVITTVLRDLQENKDWTYGYAFEQLYKGGYKIYTTVDIEMQEYLEEFYLNLENFPPVYNQGEYPQSCATIIDPNGKILAVVGGREEKTGDLVFNRATDATRQPGSSLKPLGPYALAFEYDRVHWSTIIEDGPITLSQPGQADRLWPTNYYPSYAGPMTVATAVQRSTNTVAAKLTQAITPQSIFDFLHDRLNFHSLIENEIIDGTRHSDIDLAPMALGALTKGVTPLEMAGGYQIYANGGTFTSPYAYTQVVDSNGRVILQTDTTPRRVISEDTSVVVNKLLQSVTTSSAGTGTDAALGYIPVAGKTGTSEYDVNQWFIGMTPYYICQVWLGYDREAYVNEYGTVQPSTISYGRYPPPILWKSIMDPLHQELDLTAAFPESEGVVSRQYCTASGYLAGANCQSVASGWYKISNTPSTCVTCGRATTATRRGSSSDDDDDNGDERDSDVRVTEDSIRVDWDPDE